jgi:hypothetical protein
MTVSGRRPEEAAVGVSGHRRLKYPEAVASRVERALDAIEHELNVGGIRLLSALAEGADRMAAQAVLRRESGGLVAVIPMPVDQYLQDFESLTSRREFTSLLGRAQEIVSLDPSGTREDAYLAAGIYILDHCRILLAIWDGKLGRGMGGTADIVHRARRRGLPLVRIHTDLEPGESGGLTFEAFPP